jgi:O-antigen/teichoic acid export membrane protein
MLTKQPKKYFLMYLFFMVSAAALGMLKLTIYAKLLSVEDFGLYSLVLSGYLFIMYAGSFGLNEALVKQGSIAYGRGDIKYIQELYGLAFLYSTFGVLFFFIMSSLLANIYIEDELIKKVFTLMGFLAFSTIEFNLVISYLRVNHKFVMFSFMLFMKSLLVIILTWYFAPIYGVNGVVTLEVIIFLLLAIITIYFNKPHFDYKRILRGHTLFKKTVKHGMPLMVSTVIKNLTLNIDRWVIAASLGISVLAKYAFAMILYQVSMVVIGFISTILGTKWLADFGRNSSLDRILNSIIKIMLIGFALSIALAWPIMSIISYIVDLYYPIYAGSDFKLTIIFVYFGVVFLLLVSLLDWIFIASSNERILLKFSLYSLIATALLIYYCYLVEADVYMYAFIFLVVRVFNLILGVVSIPSLLKSKVF